MYIMDDELRGRVSVSVSGWQQFLAFVALQFGAIVIVFGVEFKRRRSKFGPLLGGIFYIIILPNDAGEYLQRLLARDTRYALHDEHAAWRRLRAVQRHAGDQLGERLRLAKRDESSL